MARKPEKKQINYQSQIGVTRARGFESMANASQRSANVFMRFAIKCIRVEFKKKYGLNFGIEEKIISLVL